MLNRAERALSSSDSTDDNDVAVEVVPAVVTFVHVFHNVIYERCSCKVTNDQNGDNFIACKATTAV